MVFSIFDNHMIMEQANEILPKTNGIFRMTNYLSNWKGIMENQNLNVYSDRERPCNMSNLDNQMCNHETSTNNFIDIMTDRMNMRQLCGKIKEYGNIFKIRSGKMKTVKLDTNYVGMMDRIVESCTSESDSLDLNYLKNIIDVLNSRDYIYGSWKATNTFITDLCQTSTYFKNFWNKVESGNIFGQWKILTLNKPLYAMERMTTIWISAVKIRSILEVDFLPGRILVNLVTENIKLLNFITWKNDESLYLEKPKFCCYCNRYMMGLDHHMNCINDCIHYMLNDCILTAKSSVNLWINSIMREKDIFPLTLMKAWTKKFAYIGNSDLEKCKDRDIRNKTMKHALHKNKERDINNREKHRNQWNLYRIKLHGMIYNKELRDMMDVICKIITLYVWIVKWQIFNIKINKWYYNQNIKGNDEGGQYDSCQKIILDIDKNDILMDKFQKNSKNTCQQQKFTNIKSYSEWIRNVNETDNLPFDITNHLPKIKHLFFTPMKKVKITKQYITNSKYWNSIQQSHMYVNAIMNRPTETLEIKNEKMMRINEFLTRSELCRIIQDDVAIIELHSTKQININLPSSYQKKSKVYTDTLSTTKLIDHPMITRDDLNHFLERVGPNFKFPIASGKREEKNIMKDTDAMLLNSFEHYRVKQKMNKEESENQDPDEDKVENDGHDPPEEDAIVDIPTGIPGNTADTIKLGRIPFSRSRYSKQELLVTKDIQEEMDIEDHFVKIRAAVMEIVSSEANKSAKEDNNKKFEDIYKKMRKICKDENLVVVPTDKTKRLIAINTDIYKRSCIQMLSDPVTYKKLEHSNGKEIANTANIIEKKWINHINLNIWDRERLTTNYRYSHPAKFRGLIKDHKATNEEGIYPIRPVASVIYTPVEKLDWLLSQIFTPFLSRLAYAISNCEEFIYDINTYNNTVLNEDNVINNSLKAFSLDVVSLYPSIPLDQCLIIMMDYFSAYRNEINQNLNNIDIDLLHETMSFVMYNYEIGFDNDVYLQITGLPMGAHFAPIAANIFMDHIEHQALQKIPDIIKPSIYHRYMDDINVLIISDVNDPISMTSVETLSKSYLSIFNSINGNIKFTIEIADNNNFQPFLDIQYTWDHESNKIRLCWYQKEMHSGNAIHWFAPQPKQQKLNFISSRVKAIIKRCNNTHDINASLLSFAKQLRYNEYPMRVINGVIKKTRSNFKNIIKTGIIFPKIMYGEGGDDLQMKDLVSINIDDHQKNRISIREFNKKTHVTTNKFGNELQKGITIRIPYLSDDLNNKLKRMLSTYTHKLEYNMILINPKRTSLFSQISVKDKTIKCMDDCVLCKALTMDSDNKKNINEKCTCLTPGIVYVLTCRQCKEEYVGSSFRTVKERMKEHDYSIRSMGKTAERKLTDVSAMAEHLRNCINIRNKRSMDPPKSKYINKTFTQNVSLRPRRECRGRLVEEANKYIKESLDEYNSVELFDYYNIDILKLINEPCKLKIWESMYIRERTPEINRKMELISFIKH